MTQYVFLSKGQRVSFQYAPYKEDICIVGAKGKGKTERAKRVLETIPDIPYWIWDTSDNFEPYGSLVHRVEDLQYGQYVLQAHDKGEKSFAKFVNKAFTLRNIVIVIDELHHYVSKQKSSTELYNLVLSGRNRGISSIFITTRPASIPNWILSNITHVFAYPLFLQSDIEWFKDNFFGNEAWLLLSKDKRKGFFTSPDDYDVLPDYSYIYRKDGDTQPYVVINQ